jgi:adenine phosphoribosyltransferase
MPGDLKKVIREIPDFPKKGILFYDITTLFADARSFRRSMDMLVHRYIDDKPDIFVGVEARGFLIASALAYALGTGVVVIRKPGKLPYKTNRVAYDLEYGSNEIEIHQDAIRPGQRVVVVDDLLATGGTIKASAQLVEDLGGKIQELSFLVELAFLKGRDRLGEYGVHSLVKYD